MKKIAIASVIVLTLGLATCSSTTAASAITKPRVENVNIKIFPYQPTGIVEIKAKEQMAFIKIKKEQDANAQKLQNMVDLLKKQIGITPYIPYAASTNGWDCSGMVMWGYQQIGITLYHGATKQRYSGTIVDIPKLGDIVVFGWQGVYDTQHSAIYIGPDTMIQAGGKVGDYTEIISISKWAKSNGNTSVTYTRILDN